MKISDLGIYFEYINYVWTNSFMKYDEKSRINFINKNLSNPKNYKIIFFSIIFVILIFYLLRILSFIYSKKILYKFFFKKLQIRHNEIKKSMTHQEIYKILTKEDKVKFKHIFKYYEQINFSKNNTISFKNFYNINIQILKYAYFK